MRTEKQAKCEELSRLYAAGELKPREREAFEAHLAGCPACKKLLPEWEGLFSLLSVTSRVEPGPAFDRPIMTFVRDMIASRAAAAATPSRIPAWRQLVWVGGIAMAATVVVLSIVLRGFVTISPAGERQSVSAVAWAVDVFGRGIDWLFKSFMSTVKIGEAFVQISVALEPLWHSLRLAARHIDARIILAEVLLLILSAVLLKAVLSTAQKERCTNVGIML